MLIDTYTMIVPQKDTLAEYEQFYHRYGGIVRNSILIWKLLEEAKDILPNLFVEMSQNVRRNEKLLPSSFTLIGLEYRPGERDSYDKSIASSDTDEIRDYFDNDLSRYIEFVTNRQQFTELYTTFESTIKAFLKRDYCIDGIKQEEIVKTIIDNEVNFIEKFGKICNCEFTKEQFNKIWTYYSNLRNLYYHTGGFISDRFLKNINGVRAVLKDFVSNDEGLSIEFSVYQMDDTDLFQLGFCKAKNKNKLFAISEFNLRFFRNFIVHIWETVYLSKVPVVNAKRPYRFEKNAFDFRLCLGKEENDALQKKDQNITENNPCYNISGYVCPRCEKVGMFLYKAKFIPHVDISELLFNRKDSNYMARNIFTCPFCRSFFFPEYQKELRDNTGFNILDLNDVEYTDLLDKFEAKADINFGWGV